jgi:hypothetical protein
MNKTLAIFLAVFFGVVSLFGSSSMALTRSYSPSTITDVSWPNCKLNLSPMSGGIVGVNGGLDFHKNRCLFKESRMYNNYSLYLNTGYAGAKLALKYKDYPLTCTKTNDLCLAYNYGYMAALYSLNYATSQGVHSYMYWLDVETDNSWSSNPYVNRAELIGMYNAVSKYAFLSKVGFYSYPGQWNLLTAKWQTGLPAWAASGTASYKQSVKDCNEASFDGGELWLTQYTTKLDHNVLCQNNYSQLTDI